MVEDERIIALGLARMIADLGHEACACLPSAEAALEYLGRERPDFILLDIRLEGKMDGIEAAGIIRERWRIPYAFTSAYTDGGTMDRAKAAAPFAFVAKPLSPQSLGELFLGFLSATPCPAN